MQQVVASTDDGFGSRNGWFGQCLASSAAHCPPSPGGARKAFKLYCMQQTAGADAGTGASTSEVHSSLTALALRLSCLKLHQPKPLSKGRPCRCPVLVWHHFSFSIEKPVHTRTRPLLGGWLMLHWGGGGGGGGRGQKKVCVPKIHLQVQAFLINFIFFPRNNFLMWVGGWAGQPKSRGGGGGGQFSPPPQRTV